ncbi:MAG: 2,5-diamino-6-(ribosylamino)-4(3H)-pyrimidinone 5'-phosphate reductase [Candidatus Thermoplasmatota archaeon]|nr:2,5-diamino-6-(ribosylamino)-4(3H)-pyrimidinone 5'-phosphate reductase [Candidatus Thermoplasmatota archaeon]
MHRPRVTVNCAASIDGKLSSAARKGIMLSSPEDAVRVMRLRGSCDAIAVGVNTVIADDPRLTVRGTGGKKRPLRVVFDSAGRIPPHSRVLDGTAETVVFTCKGSGLSLDSAKVITCGQGRVDLRRALAHLYRMGARSLLVEGGGELIFSFLSLDLVDSLTVYTSPIVIGGRASPTIADGPGFRRSSSFRQFRLVNLRRLGEGFVATYVPMRRERSRTPDK